MNREAGDPPDFRLPLLAGCAWLSAWCSGALPASVGWLLAVVAACVFLGIGRQLSPRGRRIVMALGVLWVAVWVGSTLRGETVQESWVLTVAKERASGRAVVEIRGDPRVRPGLEEDRATVRAKVISVEARGRTSTATVDVMMVLSASDAHALQFGAHYEVHARLAPSSFSQTAAVLVLSERPVRVRGPSPVDRVATQIRDAIQHASLGQTVAAGLVPALVDGDERALPAGAQADFEAAGLLHLLAVSGTNFVLLGAAWLAVARRCGVRGRGLVLVGLMAIVALVVLARAEPSVIRAAVMGGVALVGLGNGRRGQAGRALCTCICLVMLFVPSLSRSPGFALSALATGGILLFANRWRDAMARWLPRLLAEGIAVCLAAYVACLPLLIALSGRVSLVAVPANLAAGVVVAPTTILGFLGGLCAMALPDLGRLIAAPATWGASWIVHVAHVAAGVRRPEWSIGVSGVGLLGIAIACALLAVAMGALLRRPIWAMPFLLGSVVLSVMPMPGGSWPPPGWVMVACDVGQGDGLVVRLADQRAVVVDAGPDPGAMRTCLRDLGVKQVPNLILTHFHADHVNGLGGVLDSAEVGVIEVTDLAEPPARAAFVERLAEQAHVPIRLAVPGEQSGEGEVTWQVLAPLEPPSPGSDSPPNDASVVLLVQVRGIRILLTGDEETDAQGVLARAYPGLTADVLKVAHHGSAKQDADLIAGLGVRHAIISAGSGNQYGLPKASTLELLHRAGIQVHRTDLDGALAVVVGEGGAVSVVSRR